MKSDGGGRGRGFSCWAAILLAGGLPACGGSQTSDTTGEAGGSFILTSPAFVDGGTLPVEYTCDGSRSSPPVAWENAPSGTQSFALTMHHIPGPGDKHVYLVLYDIPADTRSVPANVSGVGAFGINTVDGMNTYTPPCSKGPGEKLYTLTAYALSAEPKIDVSPSEVTMDVLLGKIADTTLGTATLNVTYTRDFGDAGTDGAASP